MYQKVIDVKTRRGFEDFIKEEIGKDINTLKKSNPKMNLKFNFKSKMRIGPLNSDDYSTLRIYLMSVSKVDESEIKELEEWIQDFYSWKGESNE